MKKYILGLMVSLVTVSVPSINASIPHCTPVRLTGDFTIENAQKLIEMAEQKGYDSVNPCLEQIEAAKAKGYLNSYTIKTNSLKKVDNTTVHYVFDLVVHVNPSSCKEAKLLLEIFIKNKSNHKMMHKALHQEFDNVGTKRSADVKKWISDMKAALTKGGWNFSVWQLDLNNPIHNTLFYGTKLGAYIHDNYGCTVKINDFKCELVK